MLIKEIKINKFKKLENVTIEFTNINLLTGKNATGKSSILHMVSNSFQAPTKSNYTSNEFTKVKQLSNNKNLKIEKLTKGDMKNNDPAPNVTPYYICKYYDDKVIPFRKHNSKINDRFGVKPYYKSSKRESLPKVMCIYLGLKRVVPIGEIFDDISLSKLNSIEAETWISEQYRNITGVKLENLNIMKIANYENKFSFLTDIDGIDSNTISAGQDSILSIICSLYLLKFHYENSINISKSSVLLIDEFEITLHPEFQIKLMKLLDEVCKKYSIQAFLTSHSFDAINHAFTLKWNVVYLQNKVGFTSVMKHPTMLKIQADLNNTLVLDVTKDIAIPCFFEDDEAYLIFEKIIEKHHDEDIYEIKKYIKRVQGSFPCEVIKNIFMDNPKLLKSIRSIGILDGDQHVEKPITKHLVVLPGGKCPEDIIFNLLDDIVNHPEKHKGFINSKKLENAGFSLEYFTDLNNAILAMRKSLEKSKSDGTSKKGDKREKNKKMWKSNIPAMEILVGYWVDKNDEDTKKFIFDFKSVYIKTAECYGLKGTIKKNKKQS